MERHFDTVNQLYNYCNSNDGIHYEPAVQILDRLEVAMDYEKMLDGWKCINAMMDYHGDEWSVKITYINEKSEIKEISFNN